VGLARRVWKAKAALVGGQSVDEHAHPIGGLGKRLAQARLAELQGPTARHEGHGYRQAVAALHQVVTHHGVEGAETEVQGSWPKRRRGLVVVVGHMGSWSARAPRSNRREQVAG